MLATVLLSLRRSTLTVTVALASCADSGGSLGPDTADGASAVTLRAREVVKGLEQPLFLTAPAGDSRLFIVEQPGRIRIMRAGQLLATPFLDLTDRVSTGEEQGLLGLAFHPNYAQNGYLYVDYTDPSGDTRVERYRVSADRDRADPASASLVLTVAQPYENHNGGMVAFGPDGMLYVAMGDGGSGDDPPDNGQNRGTLLGKLLRLDVDRPPAGAGYALPPDNPFAASAGPSSRGEIWASGLRNPWRFAFDAPTSRLYIADVGQSSREEIDVAGIREAGLNYGWNRMEGTQCFESGVTCDRAGLRLPVEEYGHEDGCSIIGGYVYRGRIAGIRGHYFYSDFCGGWLRSIRIADDGSVAERRTWAIGSLERVTSFGLDASGELYMLSGDGRVNVLEAQ
ncbi:MAG: PQQ-dependent sugar dehydrogenase [Gemmatimonadaceae bacterium]